uniref:Peptidase C1A papain C-terminal domain-containing protein n=1 Tax=Panagrolaimus sp. JU765 TaxID=591449 RepID=A0AC34RBL6_9BILA
MIEEPENRSIHMMPSDSEVIIATRLKRPKCRNMPVMMVVAIGGGLLLLLIILGATSIETWVSSRYSDEDGDLDEAIAFAEHSLEDRDYHLAIVNDVNARKVSWKADYNKFASRSRMSGLLSDPESQKMFMLKSIVMDRNASFRELVGDTIQQVRKLSNAKIDLPKSFDAREKWPFCESVHRVVNQGGCGSCYAIAATAVISDRICIKSKGKEQPFVSAQDLISCCKDCGGCHGTVWALLSFNHWRDHGIVSGGPYRSFEGCKPYRHSPNCGSPCSIDVYAKKHHDFMTCRKQCQPLFHKSYEDDLYKASSVYWVKVNKITAANIDQLSPVMNITNESSEVIIKRELMTNGPVLACFVVYEEFQHYKSGIYEMQTSPLSTDLYGHCAKLIGWGEVQTKKGVRNYWTFMNTWSRTWGENGFFRMFDEPEEVAAGLPLCTNLIRFLTILNRLKFQCQKRIHRKNCFQTRIFNTHQEMFVGTHNLRTKTRDHFKC